MGMREVTKRFRRPKKVAGEKTRRQKLQKTRLVALGIPEAAVNKMNTKEVRTHLKYPKKVAAAHA